MPSDAMQVWLECLAAIGIEGPGLLSTDKQAAEVIDRAIADAVAEERARIVEWLRSMDNGYPEGAGYQHAAEAVDRGDHKDI